MQYLVHLPTDPGVVQTLRNHFLSSVVAMDTYFLVVDTVELSPLQGRVEVTLPDKGTVGVAVLGTCELKA